MLQAIEANARLVDRLQPRRLPPLRERVQIRIGHGEAIAHQVGLAGQLRVHPGIPLLQLGLGRLHAVLSRRHCIQQRDEALVDLRIQEGQPLQQPIALQAAMGRRQKRRRPQVRQVLQDGGPFPQQAAVVQLQQGDIAERAERTEVPAVFRLVGLVVHPDQLEIKLQLVQDNVRRQRTGARQVIQLHGISLVMEQGACAFRHSPWPMSCTRDKSGRRQ